MPLLTVPEAARRAGIGEDAIRRAIKAGALPARKLGHYWVVQSAAVDGWRSGVPPTAPAEESGDADWGAT
jgi:excisionase family DNA binding protein